MTTTKKTARKSPLRAAITGVYGYVPPDVLGNAELAEMVDTSDEWITRSDSGVSDAMLPVQLSVWRVLRAHQPSPGSRRCGQTRAPSSTRSFCDLERTHLDGDSWVDHCPRWMSGSDRAFEELLRDVAWSQRRRWMYDREVDEPRLTSWQKIDEQTAVAYQWLEDARASLSAHYGVRFDSVGINLYRDGADSVAWHRDRIPPEIVDPVVALVSLGEPRTFLLRPQGGGKSRAFKLGRGDLLVTGGQTQRRFEHSVPKVKSSGPG